MRTKTYKLNYVFIFVEPYQQVIISDMAFHEVLPFTFQGMRFILLRNGHSFNKLLHYIIKGFYLSSIFTKTLKVLLKL